jgi:hypothetical protein
MRPLLGEHRRGPPVSLNVRRHRRTRHGNERDCRDYQPAPDNLSQTVVHRAPNLGRFTYEEVTIFFLDRPDALPQPITK